MNYRLTSMGFLLFSLVPMPAVGRPAGAASQADIVSFPARYFERFHPNTALDMVQHIPGFTYAPGDPTQRGMADAAGNVVVDGRRLADKDFSLEQVLTHIPADRVTRIDLIRGSAAGVDMLGQAVVADVIRDGKPGTFGAATISDGRYADGRTVPAVTLEATRSLEGGRTLSGTLSLSRYVEVDKGNGRRERYGPDGGIIESANVRTASGGMTGYGQAAFETPLALGQLRLDGTFTWTGYKDRQRDTTLGRMPETSIYDEDLGGLGGGQANAEIGAHYSRGFGADLGSETTLLLRRGWKIYTSLLADPASMLGFREKDRTAELVGHTQWHYQLSPALSAEAIFEVASNRLDTSSLLNLDGSVLPVPDANAVVTERRVDAGGDVIWTPVPLIQVTAGLHVERSVVRAASDDPQRHVYAFPKPDLRLVFKIDRRQELRLRFEREVGQLAFADFIAAASLDKGSVSTANAGISPQHDWIAEITYELRTAGGSALVLTYGHSWLHDVIDWIPVGSANGGPATYDARGNIGSGQEDKVSLSASLPLDGVRIARGQLTLAGSEDRTRVADPIDGRERAISDLKPFQLTAGFQQDLPRLRTTWGMSYESP